MGSDRGWVRVLDFRQLKRMKFLLGEQFSGLTSAVVFKKETQKLYGRSLLQEQILLQIMMADQFSGSFSIKQFVMNIKMGIILW